MGVGVLDPVEAAVVGVEEEAVHVEQLARALAHASANQDHVVAHVAAGPAQRPQPVAHQIWHLYFDFFGLLHFLLQQIIDFHSLNCPREIEVDVLGPVHRP